jgi:hypothetical protein
MRKLKHLFDNLLHRKGELTPRDQARLRLASELGPRKEPAYQVGAPVPWYDRALERIKRDS